MAKCMLQAGGTVVEKTDRVPGGRYINKVHRYLITVVKSAAKEKFRT